MIYFDNNATTPITDEVLAAMMPYLAGSYGNPSSAYSFAAASKKVIEDTREQVAMLLGARSSREIVFTSGGTEGDNWAIMGALAGREGVNHIITTPVEHEAVRNVCQNLETKGRDVTWLEISEEGSIDLDELRLALRDDTAIVSIMLANNETGILFPVREIAEVVKAHSKALFHVDGVNAAGKVEINLADSAIDLLTISAHKFHGPKGIGAIYIRDGVELPPILFGGGQENRMRPGTEAVHQIAGLGAAARSASNLSSMSRVQELRDRLENGILSAIPAASVNGTRDANRRLPNTASIAFENTNGEMILHLLDEQGVCVSTGSACNAADRKASPVLAAMNVPYTKAMGTIRFSLSRLTTADEVDRVVSLMPGIIAGLN